MPELAKSLSGIRNHSLEALKPSGIRMFNNRISGIPGLLKMTLGEPDFNTPEHVKMAGIKAIVNNDSHYSAQPGTPALRKGIAHYLKVSQGLNYDWHKEIVATTGATEAIFATLTALLNPGDEVVIPTPSYALYFPITKLLGAKVIPVDVSDNDFHLTAQKLESVIKQEKGKVKALILNYPGNPTGAEYPEDILKSLAKVIKSEGIFCITDEIYCELIYGAKHYSMAKYAPNNTILMNGVSKSHAMTGWRIGYAAGPASIMKMIAQVHGYMVTSLSNPAQAAAAEALLHGLTDPASFRKVYKKRRDYIVKALNDMGLKTLMPNGAFYAFAQIPKSYGKDDEQFALDLAHKAKVGVIPGHVFGPGGEGHIRLSYATSMPNIKEAMRRISKFLKTLK
ncbi:aminotransferase class I/II-fold pyridoxal phosphate-dependent enzyme [Acetilactobacillus jinshanensis]|uniref:Aminotransferase n=1 Tax=Acetilactobacillus jinshanensis TaxID=1720083 RepID=A0A4P6ZKV4_9LACO|nr:aminotransferase class I/II-fold pyridoxal phosphate-dependent enzyme [Acetilactobacillus jinshanensis]QBP18157.1 aminotransferase class I/II-fold pyridoxal phosphate-dependent enzyme [Acetilactobacillus jinshanensis]URL61024.1 aminotransferase class I/II-fold pyridoxal phosphate-dependent enzyme [uncultured bacterium]